MLLLYIFLHVLVIEFIFFNIPGVNKNSSVRNFARIHWRFSLVNPNLATFVQGTFSIHAHGSASLQPLRGTSQQCTILNSLLMRHL